MKKKHPGTRAWYAGKAPPEKEILDAIAALDDDSQVIYDNTHEGQGEYSEIVKRIYNQMDSLKRTPAEFRTWTVEDGIETFFAVLIDFSSADLRSRVQTLQRLGTFKFRAVDSSDAKRAKIAAVFASPDEDEDYKARLSSQARRLSTIWTPKPGSMLDFIVNQPAQVGRVLSDRLNPANEQPLKLIGHPFTRVRSHLLQPLADARLLAYEQDAEIHLVTAVRTVLENWDQDAMTTGGCEQFCLLDALLLHEFIEVVLDETEPDLEPFEAHIIASTFERYLKGEILNVAVEDFFLGWPQPSSEEIAERQKIEMEQQLKEMSAFMGEDEVPEEEEGLDDLPMDTDVARPKKKKVRVKKKVAKGKAGKQGTLKKGTPKKR